MITAIALIALLAVSIFAISAITHVSADEKKQSMRDLPNFKPKITKITQNGKVYEIVEFVSKLKK